uniref:interferon-induced GTP-binding protein Mx3 n=1 Tax=Oncorhynchus gorbuscha TaxID=8017 RepID=UPI001EAF1D9A|nr:interferon-induced GTP-binding protein Mx3 [Oncorhynchus gorbuscha]
MHRPDAGSEDEERDGMQRGVFYSHLDRHVRPFIELIDFLRSIGIEKDLALPAIAVVGDQSSGKSSVLEALSGVALPRGSGIVTRCPLELKLRKCFGGKWKAKISYQGVVETFEDPSLVEIHVKTAQNTLAGDGVGICDDLITLEITSPDVCDLTLIDLPGITRVPVTGQPEDIGDQIRRLILKFIKKQETINLVVVPCNVDIATTEALRMAQSVDPEGARTLAILTKPDLVDKGAEPDILKIVNGQVVHLNKGYIIVKCRGQNDINQKISLADATRLEMEFFKNHHHFSPLLEQNKVTTQCLATKLTQDLVDHIKTSLPYLTDQIREHLETVKTELKKYSTGPPLERKKMGPYLTERLIDFIEKINELCRIGNSSEKNLHTCLRPVFQQWDIYLSNTKGSFLNKVAAMIKNYDKEHRGRELITFSDYCVYEHAVQKHILGLQEPALDVLKAIRGMVQAEFRNVCEACFKSYPQLRSMALTKIDEIQTKQETKVEKRIKEYINMERLVYTQDSIFIKGLKDHKAQFKEAIEEERFYDPEEIEDITATFNSTTFDSRKLTPDKLGVYYEIVYQRLADYVPMLILQFMLKESAKMLCIQIMDQRDGADVVKLLSEDSMEGRRRADLHQRLDRLKKAQEKLSEF